MIQLEIFGRPVPSNSHKKNANGFIYDPRKKEKELAQWQLKSQFNQKPYSVPIELKIIYYFKIPKRTSFIKKKLMLSNQIKHAQTPDTDNLIKFTKDVLKGIVMLDDKQVWNENPRRLWCESEKDEKTLIYVLPDIYDKSSEG